MSYLLDLLRAQFEGYKAAVPVESREFIEAKLEALEARAGGAAAARAIRAAQVAGQREKQTEAISAGFDNYLKVRPALRPRECLVMVRGWVHRHKNEFGLDKDPSMRAVRAVWCERLEISAQSDIKATSHPGYARSTFASTSAST